MSLTLEDVVCLHHEQLRTISQKLIYLSIQRRASESGWTRLGLAELQALSGLTESGVLKTLKRMQKVGLIEVMRDRSHPHNKNLYRTISL